MPTDDNDFDFDDDDFGDRGGKEWVTYIQSQQEFVDFMCGIGDSAVISETDVGSIMRNPGIDFAVINERDNYFSKGDVIIHWSSGSDSVIQFLPYYIRQQTTYLQNLKQKFKSLNIRDLGERVSRLEVPYGSARFMQQEYDEFIKKYPFIANLPKVKMHNDVPKTEGNFVKNMYKKLYTDPSSVSGVKESVFISYSSKDRKFAMALAADIEKYGPRVWIDEGEIRVGDSLIRKIFDAIESCDYLIVVLSKTSVESNWVKKELEVAMMQELTDERVKVMPVIKEKCEIPSFLAEKLYIDFSNKRNRREKIQKIIASMNPDPALKLKWLFQRALGEENVLSEGTDTDFTVRVPYEASEET